MGDTKDHRRVSKDPSLNQISVEFVVNMVNNLKALGLDHYIILASSSGLCKTLHDQYRVEGCAWSSYLHENEGLKRYVLYSFAIARRQKHMEVSFGKMNTLWQVEPARICMIKCTIQRVSLTFCTAFQTLLSNRKEAEQFLISKDLFEGSSYVHKFCTCGTILLPCCVRHYGTVVISDGPVPL